MSTLLLLLATCALCAASNNVDATTDCEIRRLAYAFAQKQLPEKGQLPMVHDALEISKRCGTERPSFAAAEEDTHSRGVKLDMPPADYTVKFAYLPF
mgnify:CR=1 FL=1